MATASWSDDEAELTQQWEVNVPTEDEAVREVMMLLPSKPQHVEAKLLLPILHTERGDWHFTALFSNTARAHELGRTRDWVVIYFHHDSGPEGQRTVVTETRGPHAGHRTVRGREAGMPGAVRRGLLERPALTEGSASADDHGAVALGPTRYGSGAQPGDGAWCVQILSSMRSCSSATGPQPRPFSSRLKALKFCRGNLTIT